MRKQYTVFNNSGHKCIDAPLEYPAAVAFSLKMLNENESLLYLLIAERTPKESDVFKVRRDGTIILLESFLATWKTGDQPELSLSQITDEEVAAVKLDKRLHMRIRFWHVIAAFFTGRKTLHKLKSMIDATSPGTCCIPRSLWERMTIDEKKNLFSYAIWNRSAVSVMWKH